MIPQAFITEWRTEAPWAEDAQVEQDLIISRTLIEIFSSDELHEALGFRGGTALNKLHLDAPRRYSEDIDLVQLSPGPIGEIINPLQHRLERLLGEARVSIRERSARLLYGFHSEIEPVVPLRLKIEIDTRDHEPVLGLITREFEVRSGWFTGSAAVPTYAIDELMGTKLRALYQRSKGRDLFDLALVLKERLVDPDTVVRCFLAYLERQGLSVSRAQFEENLLAKVEDPRFAADVRPLLRSETSFASDRALELVMTELVAGIPGDPWRGRPGPEGA